MSLAHSRLYTFLFFFSEGDTVLRASPSRSLRRFLLYASFLILFSRSSHPFFFRFFYFFFREFSQKRPRKYSLGERPIMPYARREPARNFRVLIKHGALNGWCFRQRELETRHTSKRSVIAGRN